jgi:hypothetical protein
MVTDSLQKTTGSDGLLARLGIQLWQLVCGLHGHDDLLHFEQGRISLQCASCGYQSPGWEVKPGSTRPEASARPDASAPSASRARILRLPAVNHRHVA